MGPDEKLVALRQKATEVERLRATREAQADQAEATMREAALKLKDEFGCTSLAEAKTLLAEKKTQLEKILERVEGLLK